MKKAGKSRDRKVKRVRKENCQQRKAGLGLQSWQQEELSRFRDDEGKPDQEKVASSGKMPKERNVKGKKTSRQTAGSRKGCQDSKMSRANRIMRQEVKRRK